jgi:uncharacterized repeat protein (TIGR03803 family)
MKSILHHNFRRIAAILGIAVALAGIALPARAQTYTQLSAFQNDLQYGDFAPSGPLVLAQDGILYGTTDPDWTAIYSMTTTGTETPLWHSTVLESGGQCEWGYGSAFPPATGLTLGADGLLYGTCQNWTGNPQSSVIYRFNPSQLGAGFMVVYSFPITDGVGYSNPSALTLGTDGNLYGTAYPTGVSPTTFGVVFQFNPTTKKLTTLHTFRGRKSGDGAYPYGPLALGANGDFYGTTAYGGLKGGSNGGTFYSITTKGKFELLHSFNTITDHTSGTYPSAGVALGNNGNFYGVTLNGGEFGQGTIFEATPAGKITWLHEFNETDDLAGSPLFPLTLGSDGNFYSAATNNNGVQSLFEIETEAKDGVYKYKDLHNFPTPGSSNCGSDTPGCLPTSTILQLPNGIFYGVTFEGGADDDGTFYSLNMGLKPFVLLQFPVGTEGDSLGIFGQGFQTGPASAVSFNGKRAKFTVVSDTYMTATIPTGATAGYVTVTEPSGALKSNIKFTPRK